LPVTSITIKYSLVEAERFDKDYCVADRKIRETGLEKKHVTINTLRQERL
jgi:hypothetical protein